MSSNPQRSQRSDRRAPSDLKTPVRNHYFYGKLLDVFHLELEQNYFKAKHQLVNRLVTGPGVVCGLGVELTEDNSVIVRPGLAIDRCGREIVVPHTSKRVPLPPLPDYQKPHKEYKEYQGSNRSGYDDDSARYQYCETPFAHIVLCYHECGTDPVPTMAGDCETVAVCASGSIREQYKIEVKEGFAPQRYSNFPRDAIEGGKVNYRALVDYITDNCRAWPDDCCIPLANVELRHSEGAWEPEIDISVRPIVYTNRLLFDLIKALVRKEESEDSEV